VGQALQGVFGALLAPAALATLATTFTDPKERSKAFGIFGAVAGGGSAVGLVLGGVLTEWLSWRWCLYVNLLFAAVAVAGALVLLHNPRERVRPKLNLPGTLLASAALFCLVVGFSHAATKGWIDAVTLGALALGVLLLVVFVLDQHPRRGAAAPAAHRREPRPWHVLRGRGAVGHCDLRGVPYDLTPAGEEAGAPAHPLADHAHSGRFVLLDRTPTGALAAAAAGWAKRITVVHESEPAAGCPAPYRDPTGMLTRPDGVIAWASETPDPATGATGAHQSHPRAGTDELLAALHQWAGTPTPPEATPGPQHLGAHI